MSEPWDSVLSIQTVLTVYAEGMRRYGGRSSNPTDGCLEGSMGSAWTAEQYRSAEGIELGLLFAAYVFVYLIKNHCFVDGNKRVGWACMAYVLHHHGVAINATDDEAVQLTTAVASGEIEVGGVISWLADDDRLGPVV